MLTNDVHAIFSLYLLNFQNLQAQIHNNIRFLTGISYLTLKSITALHACEW